MDPRRPAAREATARRERPAGALGEDAAADLLRDLGFRLEARNLRTVHGEIDLLARRRRLWIAVEVKASRSHPAPEQTVSAAQLDRIGRALHALAPGLRPRPRALRIDVVAVHLQADGTVRAVHFPGLRQWADPP